MPAGYAALAQHLDVPFVTAERLVRKLAKSDCKIVWLGDRETWS